MKKAACILAILAMAGTAGAAEHWRGAGFGGDGTTWSQAANWDSVVPWGTSWDVNRSGEQGTPANHVINVDAGGSTTSGRIYAQSGYKTAMTIKSGVTLNMQTLTIDNGAVSTLTIEPGAQWNINLVNAQMQNGSGTNIDIYGGLNTYDLLLLDGNVVIDVYGVGECYRIGKFSDDGGHAINVYNGGLFAVGAGGINWDGNTSRRIGMYVSGKVQLAGDRTGDYLSVVKNLEPGTWDVDYGVTRAGWTTIHLVPEPASLLLLAFGLPLLRRRR